MIKARVEEIRATLDMARIIEAANGAVDQLQDRGFTTTVFSPGDATRYAVVVIDQERTHPVDFGGRYAIAWNYGKLRALPNDLASVDYGYVECNYIDPRYRNDHTAVVLTEFVRALGRALTRNETP